MAEDASHLPGPTPGRSASSVGRFAQVHANVQDHARGAGAGVQHAHTVTGVVLNPRSAMRRSAHRAQPSPCLLTQQHRRRQELRVSRSRSASPPGGGGPARPRGRRWCPAGGGEVRGACGDRPSHVPGARSRRCWGPCSRCRPWPTGRSTQVRSGSDVEVTPSRALMAASEVSCIQARRASVLRTRRAGSASRRCRPYARSCPACKGASAIVRCSASMAASRVRPHS